MTATTTGTSARVRSFEDFYTRERRGLYRALTFALGDPSLAADAVDEAMARAYARWGTVSRYDNPAGWVYRVGLNWARSRFRVTRRLSRAPVPERAGPEQLPVDHELWTAVAQLPEAQRDALVLRFQFDWSVEQIASALDAPAGTIKSRIHRGLEALRAHLEVSR